MGVVLWNEAVAKGMPLGGTATAGRPLIFEAGPAQTGDRGCFLARGCNYQFLLAPTEAQIVLCRSTNGVSQARGRFQEFTGGRAGEARLVRMQFVGASARAMIQGVAELPGKVNYLLGNEPARWRTGVATYAHVRVEGLYPGVDLEYYGNQRQLEYDFAIAPGVDPAAIAIHFAGVDKVAIDASGELVLSLGEGEVRQHPPVIYQVVNGARQQIAGGYRLREGATVAFSVGQYDSRLPLVIDPVFSYSTYFGGNGGDSGYAVKVDTNGSVYLAGKTFSTQFPFAVPTNGFQPQLAGRGDAFVAKLDNTGSNVVYYTYLGGTGDDAALDMALDNLGNVFLAGFTGSPDFPTKNALFPTIGGLPDPNTGLFPPSGFVAELNTNGTALVYSTYLGGNSNTVASGIAIDPSGNALVTGYTYSPNFPVTNAIQSVLAGLDDVFVSKIGAGGTNLVYSTYLGGESIDEGEGIAVDATGSAYVTGYTLSTAFPVTTNAQSPTLGGPSGGIGSYDAFVTRIAPSGTNLVYSTYLGGYHNDYGYRIAVDGAQNAYVTGQSQSTDFPNTVTNVPGLQAGNNGINALNSDAFLTKLDSSGMRLYSALFGGSGEDTGSDVAVDALGRAFVIGTTLSVDFRVTNAFGLLKTNSTGGKDAILLALNANASAVLYSGYLGGSSDEYGDGIALDSESSAYLTGLTFSTDFPTTPGSLQPSTSGPAKAFLAKLRLRDNPVLAVSRAGTNVLVQWPATAPEYELQIAPTLQAPINWTSATNVSQTPVLNNGKYAVTVPPTNGSSFFRLHRR